MYEYEGLGDIKSFGKAFKNLGEKALKPLTTKISLNPIKQAKTLTRSGIDIGKAAEKVVVSLNPLNPTLKKFDEKGLAAKKRGGIGGWLAGLLGGVGEQARTKPILTIATVGVAAKAYAAYGAAAGATGTATAATGTAAGATAGSGVLSTVGTWIMANPGTSMSLLSTGAKLAASRGAKEDDINPDTGMPYYAMTDEQATAQAQADQAKSNKVKVIAGMSALAIALTVGGIMLFNPPKHRP